MSPGEIGLTAENIDEHEHLWPTNVALIAGWTPEAGGAPLKAGYRGALIRVEENGRVRVAFGRHGNHEVPIERTDLVERANQVRRGELHKVAPCFLAHFGTQFIEVLGKEVSPVQTPRIAHAKQFLLILADPREPGFEEEAKALVPLRDENPDLQILYFPIGLAHQEIAPVRDALSRSALMVPFAYPAAADVHARALFGSVPKSAEAVLITPEGRILERAPLDAPDLADRIRLAAGNSTDTPAAP
ncbi:MAG: hypothetical protein IPK00_06135 [Deltaproteobacteria bacterium]|nr:hypothetical protein [Deltaproteobacteria bacterium]